MDRLPKKKAIQKTKKTKVEKPKPHVLDPQFYIIPLCLCNIGVIFIWRSILDE